MCGVNVVTNYSEMEDEKPKIRLPFYLQFPRLFILRASRKTNELSHSSAVYEKNRMEYEGGQWSCRWAQKLNWRILMYPNYDYKRDFIKRVYDTG